jgi:hypothetical protein
LVSFIFFMRFVFWMAVGRRGTTRRERERQKEKRRSRKNDDALPAQKQHTPQTKQHKTGANIVALDKFAMANSARDVAAAEWWVDRNPADAGAPARGVVPALAAPGTNTRSVPAQFLSVPLSAAAASSSPSSFSASPLAAAASAAAAAANNANTTKAAEQQEEQPEPQPFLVHYGITGTREVRGAAQSRRRLSALASWLRLEVRALPLSAALAPPGPFAAGGDGVAQPAAGTPIPAAAKLGGAPIWAVLPGTDGARLPAPPADEPADFPLGRTLGASKPAPLALPETPRLGGVRYIKDRLYTVAAVWVPAAEAAAAAGAKADPGAAVAAAPAAGANKNNNSSNNKAKKANKAEEAEEGRVAAWWLEVDQPLLSARRSGVVSYDQGSLLSPTIAVNKRGRAVVAATAVGEELFPSAAVATLDFGSVGGFGAAGETGFGAGGEWTMTGEEEEEADADAAPSPAASASDAAASGFTSVAHTLRLPGPGAGLADGQAAYASLASGRGSGARPSASAVGVDGTLWSAVEMVAQACSLAEYKADATCGGTRSPGYNWATRVTQVEADG